MQTIYLDISNKGVIPRIEAKQNDVGRKFLAVITDGGVPYEIKVDSVVSVWYDGVAGKGNYTEIGNKPAISVTGNKITIELIAQMLSVAGDGVITVLVNSANGDQIGLWNIDYCVEYVPGIESEKAEEYYTAFSQSAASLAQSAETIGRTQERIDSIIKAKNATTAGLIYPLASANVPSGFLLCDGAAYSRTEYAELFEAIGETYGVGDGETTFNVPNLQTRVPVGAGNGYVLGQEGGEDKHTLTENEMPRHRHSIWDEYGSLQFGVLGDVTVSATQGGNGYVLRANLDTATDLATSYAGEGSPHNIMQPYTVVNYIVSTGKEVEFVVGGTGCGNGVSSVELDTTLTQAGKAADAKAVGDKISDLQTALGDVDTALDSIIALQNSLIGGGT